ncbi:uncharacterized protein KZ484_025085 [Pholidichthys leucotaenia]
MDQDREDRVCPSKPLWGDHEVQTKGQRSEQHTGPGPGPSCVSIRSDKSNGLPVVFKHDHDDPSQIKPSRRRMIQASEQTQPWRCTTGGFSKPEGRGRTKGVVSAMVQDLEDRVRPSKPLWGDHEVQTKGQRSEQRTGPGPGLGPGPGPSCVSIRSDKSKGLLVVFNRDHDDPAQMLNDFFARFEASNPTIRGRAGPSPPSVGPPFTINTADTQRTLTRVNPRKAAGPDNIPGHVLRDCASELVDVLTDIYNISLSQAIVPRCFKTSIIVPVAKKPVVSCLNDYCPVALTPIVLLH